MNADSPYPFVELHEVLRQDKNYVTELEPRMYPKLSVKLYGLGVVLDQPADGATVRMKRHQIAKAGQVILSEIWAKKGAIGIVPEEGTGALITSHFFLFDVQESKLHPEFMEWLLRANYFGDSLLSKARGTTGYAAIRPKQFLNMQIPLPSLEEQRRIVGRIEVLAGKVEEARRLRETAVKEAGLLLQSAKQTLFDPEDMKAQHWTEHSLGDIAEIRAGVTLGRTLSGRTIKIPYLRVANVQDGYLDLEEVKEVEIREDEFQKWQLQMGDILLTEGGDWDKLGRGTVWEATIPNCIHQNHIFRVRIDQNEFEPYFLLALISSPYGKAYFQGASKQTTNLASINQRQLKAFTVFKPKYDEQLRIIGYLQDLQSKLASLQKLQESTQREIDALLPSILDKAFKGEL